VKGLIKSLFFSLICFFSCDGFSRDLEVQGHRGYRALHPENTLPLELDILATADDKLVIHHDFFINKDLCAYLDGTAITKEVLVRSLTLEQLKKLDAGMKSNPLFPGQTPAPGTQIPTLQELFDFINTSPIPHAKKIRLNLEIKRDLRFPEWTLSPSEMASAITKQVKQSGLEDRVYYSSFDPEILAAIRQVDPSASTGLIFEGLSLEVARLLHPDAEMEFLLQIASLLDVNVLSPSHELLHGKEEVLSWQNKGFRVIPWTVNDPKRWGELIEMGVNGIISDDPQALRQFFREYSKP
jgi:glycerophosphoryl diester phosphodiesterase